MEEHEVRIDRGTVVLLALDPTVGHEQRGVRPCVVVSDPADEQQQQAPQREAQPRHHRVINPKLKRNALVCVVP